MNADSRPRVTEDRGAHWDAVYGGRDDMALTWFEAEPGLSLDLIRAYAAPGDPIIDVGGGASRLVDRLLEAGFGPVTVLDVSGAGLATSRARLGVAAEQVHWIVSDVTRWTPPEEYRVWHDRAAFHFLTDALDQALYIATLEAALAPGGIAIIATFDATGPERCSGLRVERYAPEELCATLETVTGGRLRCVETRRHRHVTPGGATQDFQVSVFRKDG